MMLKLKGFSLVEIVISLLFAQLLWVSGLYLAIYTSRTYQFTRVRQQLQANAWFIGHLLQRQLSIAGYQPSSYPYDFYNKYNPSKILRIDHLASSQDSLTIRYTGDGQLFDCLHQDTSDASMVEEKFYVQNSHFVCEVIKHNSKGVSHRQANLGDHITHFSAVKITDENHTHPEQTLHIKIVWQHQGAHVTLTRYLRLFNLPKQAYNRIAAT